MLPHRSRYLPVPSTPGFTLIELLVVIGIVALLVALLMPVLSGARDAANRAKCLANLRSMAQAAFLHAQEIRTICLLPESKGQCISEFGLRHRDFEMRSG